jgi:hypothetical protein
MDSGCSISPRLGGTVLHHDALRAWRRRAQGGCPDASFNRGKRSIALDIIMSLTGDPDRPPSRVGDKVFARPQVAGFSEEDIARLVKTEVVRTRAST